MTHLSFSQSGGAGKVALRLQAAQQKAGWEARLLSASSTDLRNAPWENPLHTVSAAIDEFIGKKPNFPSLFSLTRDDRVALKNFREEEGIFHLHWINGLADLEKLQSLKTQPVVWTLHDMNAFTGGCHYSLACERFNNNCSGCPAVRTAFQSPVSKNLTRKRKLYQTWQNLRMVAPSNWMATQASRSSALQGVPISIIHNPIDSRFFDYPRTQSRRHSGFPPESTVLAVIAAQLDSPVKAVDWAVKAFVQARRENPDLTLVLVGSGGESYQGLTGIRVIPPLGVPELIEILERADALISPSLADNSPSVAFEAASRGVPSVVRNSGGLPEIVSNLRDGVVLEAPGDLEHLLINARTALNRSTQDKNKLKDRARKISEPSAVAQQYIDLYESME